MSALLEGLPVVIAGLNLPRQTVVSGESSAIATVESRARARGWRAVHLPVSHAFHSPLMAPAAAPLGARLRRTPFAPLARTVCSTVTGAVLPREENLVELLERQLVSPVRFMDAVEAMGGVDLAIEIGPGGVMAGMARELLPCPVIALDVGGGSLRGLLAAAGAAHVLGAVLRTEALFGDRFARSFDLDRPLRFLENPCEQAPLPVSAPSAAVVGYPRDQAERLRDLRNGAGVDVLERVRHAVGGVHRATVGVRARRTSAARRSSPELDRGRTDGRRRRPGARASAVGLSDRLRGCHRGRGRPRPRGISPHRMRGGSTRPRHPGRHRVVDPHVHGRANRAPALTGRAPRSRRGPRRVDDASPRRIIRCAPCSRSASPRFRAVGSRSASARNPTRAISISSSRAPSGRSWARRAHGSWWSNRTAAAAASRAASISNLRAASRA